jgi:hypothetical protein
MDGRSLQRLSLPTLRVLSHRNERNSKAVETRRMSGKQLIKQRQRYYQADPHCHWCRAKLELPVYGNGVWPTAPNHATIDHLNSRLSSARHLPQIHPDESRRVLACYRCNQERNRAEIVLSGKQKPLSAKPLSELREILLVLHRKPPKKKWFHPQIKAVEREMAWRQFGNGWDYLLD